MKISHLFILSLLIVSSSSHAITLVTEDDMPYGILAVNYKDAGPAIYSGEEFCERYGESFPVLACEIPTLSAADLKMCYEMDYDAYRAMMRESIFPDGRVYSDDRQRSFFKGRCAKLANPVIGGTDPIYWAYEKEKSEDSPSYDPSNPMVIMYCEQLNYRKKYDEFDWPNWPQELYPSSSRCTERSTASAESIAAIEGTSPVLEIQPRDGRVLLSQRKDMGVLRGGTFYHEVTDHTARFVYLCIDGDCRTPVKKDGYWERKHVSQVYSDNYHYLEFKVQDDDIGQCIFAATVKVDEGIESDCSKSTPALSLDLPLSGSTDSSRTIVPEPTPDPMPLPASLSPSRGIVIDGDVVTLWFRDEGWRGNWNYLCFADHCVSGQLVDGRWQRDISDLGVQLGNTYPIQIKIDRIDGGQYISPFFDVVPSSK